MAKHPFVRDAWFVPCQCPLEIHPLIRSVSVSVSRIRVESLWERLFTDRGGVFMTGMIYVALKVYIDSKS